MVQGLAVLNHPTYDPQRWQATLIFYLMTSFVWLFNTRLGLCLPKLQVIVLIVHLVGFLATLIPLVYLAPKGKPADVFQTFVNEGGWPSDGLSFFIGSIGAMFAFIGEFVFSCSTRMSHMSRHNYFSASDFYITGNDAATHMGKQYRSPFRHGHA